MTISTNTKHTKHANSKHTVHTYICDMNIVINIFESCIAAAAVADFLC